MKILNPTLVCGYIAVGISFSVSAAATTYVVPAGTAGNTPEAPYDTWAKAANNPRVAADATDAEGTIYILGGSYPNASRMTPENNVHVKIMATQSTTGAFGEMVVSNVIAGYSTSLSSTDDKRRFQVDGGTIKMTPTSGNVFTEYVSSSGAWGQRQRVRLVLTGDQTKLDTTSSGSTYIGYSTKNYGVVVKDGAQLATRSCTVCRQSNASDMDFLVANGASVTCNGSFSFADAQVENGVLTISNATLSVTNGAITIGNAASRNTRMTLVGARPLVYASASFNILGEGSALVMNVAEAPLGGYAESVVGGATTRSALRSMNSTTVASEVDFRVEGVAALSARILAEQTPPLSASWTLIEVGNSGGSVKIADEKITAVNMQLVADGLGNFYLEKSSNGRTLYLKYACKAPVVYVTPEGTAGNTPGFPYDSWGLAANSVKTGAQAVAVGGTVVIASGTYDPDPGSGTQWNCFPSWRAVFRAVASASDPSPGNVTLSRNGFASGYRNINPDRFNVTLAYGTFAFATNGPGQCFLEYTDNNIWNVDNRCQLTVAGEQATLDNSNADFYVGMTSSNVMLRVTDHARCLTKRVYAGANNGNGAKVLIDSSATFSNVESFVLAYGSKDVTVTVSNATLQTQSVGVHQSTSTPIASSNVWLNILDHGVLSLTGTSFSPFQTLTSASGVVFDDSTFDQTTVAFNFSVTGTNNTLIVRNGARVNVKSLTLGASGKNTGFAFLVDNASVSTPNACTLDGDAKLKLDVSNVALDGTAPTFVSVGTLTVGVDAAIELAGVADLKSRMAAANVRRCKVTLLKATSSLGVSDAAIQAMSESLPDDTTLQRTSTALVLRVGPPKGIAASFR